MNILSLDRGSKRIGIAWMDTVNNTPLPLGYLINKNTIYSDLSSLIMQYHIDMVLYGYPTGNRNVIAKIDNFINNMKYCVADTVMFQSIDEHYSSTQASDVTGDLGRKHISQDTVSAMILLERWNRNE